MEEESLSLKRQQFKILKNLKPVKVLIVKKIKVYRKAIQKLNKIKIKFYNNQQITKFSPAYCRNIK